jgi:peptide/nickel transport system permease protein
MHWIHACGERYSCTLAQNFLYFLNNRVLTAIIILLTAIFAPFLAPYPPNQQDLYATTESPSHSHWLGTDALGRDQFSRIIFGTRIAILVGVVAVALAAVVGMGLGLVAGYFGSWVQVVIMRFIDVLMAFPPIVLILAIAVLLGGGLFNVLLAIGIGLLPTYARLMYGQILALKQNDYVTAAGSIGAGNTRIMFFHLLPNAFPSLLILITMNMGTAILMEASLSFLGIGISPSIPTWGSMVNVGYQYILINPWLSLSPGIAILLVVLAFNLVGDGFRDALDPRLRGRI